MQDLTAGGEGGRLRTRRLWAEFALLYGGVPLAMLAGFGLYPLFPVLLVLAAIAAWLLSRTPGWSWRELIEGGLLRHWRMLAVFTGACAATILTLVLWLRPDSLLAIPTYRPALWAVIVVFYPFLSALPQELIFRPLFFRRYGGLFRDPRLAIAVNGVVFGVGHLFYQNAVAIGLSAIAGGMIGWAYWRTRSFLLAWALHAIGGILLFTLGLNSFFYHGAVPR